MNSAQSKLTIICLVIIAASLAVIAYRQLQPNYITIENGQIMDSRSGKIFYNVSGRLILIEGSAEEELRREYPDGKTYK